MWVWVALSQFQCKIANNRNIPYRVVPPRYWYIMIYLSSNLGIGVLWTNLDIINEVHKMKFHEVSFFSWLQNQPEM